MKRIIFVLIVIALVIAGFFSLRHSAHHEQQPPTPAVTTPPSSTVDEAGTVEAYVRDHIATLAPDKPVLGGSWYVVNITVDTTTHNGTMVYEDGHIQSAATFHYVLEGNPPTVHIEGVTLTKTPPPAPQTVCTQEARQCPDGSYVGRTGPNCEFATCPTTSGAR